MAQNQNENSKFILLILMLAVLAQLASVKIAHGEAFLPDDPLARGLTVELRPSATVMGGEIRLRQIARWGAADKAALDPIGELVVARFGNGMAFATVSLSDVKALLRDAGVNVATMNFVGTIECRVNRTDAQLASADTMEQYSVAARTVALPAAMPSAALTAPKVAPEAEKPTLDIAAATTPDGAYRTLRQALAQDLSQRLNIPVEDLEITFRPQDEANLRLSEPHVAFDIQPQRAGQLGEVSWSVNLVGNSATKRLYIRAVARAWRQQTIVSKPLATKQLITENDVTTTRKLVDTLPNDTVLSHDQVVGQMASRDLKAGAIVTAHLVDPVQLVRGGQFVTMMTGTGGINVKTVVRAMEPGTLGQTIAVRNDVTKEQFSATITGEQQVTLAGN